MLLPDSAYGLAAYTVAPLSDAPGLEQLLKAKQAKENNGGKEKEEGPSGSGPDKKSKSRTAEEGRQQQRHPTATIMSTEIAVQGGQVGGGCLGK